MNSQPVRDQSSTKQKKIVALQNENVRFLFNEMYLSLKVSLCVIVILQVKFKFIDQKIIKAITCILCKTL